MCAVECATQFTFPSFLFYLKKKSFRFWTTRTKKKKDMRKNRENAKDGCHWHQDWHQSLFV